MFIAAFWGVLVILAGICVGICAPGFGSIVAIGIAATGIISSLEKLARSILKKNYET